MPPNVEDEQRGDGQIGLANYAVISYELDRGWWGLPLGEELAVTRQPMGEEKAA